jgi:hypothetical protein
MFSPFYCIENPALDAGFGKSFSDEADKKLLLMYNNLAVWQLQEHQKEDIQK